jgi:hypothetical protein
MKSHFQVYLQTERATASFCETVVKQYATSFETAVPIHFVCFKEYSMQLIVWINVFHLLQTTRLL